MHKKSMVSGFCIFLVFLFVFCGCVKSDEQTIVPTFWETTTRAVPRPGKSIFDDAEDYAGYESYDPYAGLKQDKREKSYDALKAELEKNLAAKEFPEIAEEMMRQILDRLYETYENWTDVYDYLPDKYTFIRSHFIDIIPKIKSIFFKDEGNPEYDEAVEAQYIGSAASDGKNIYYVYVPEKDENGQYDLWDIETLLHEMQHVMQEQAATDCVTEEPAWKCMLEGGASYYAGFFYNYSAYQSSYYYYTGIAPHRVSPRVGAGGNYLYYQNLYEKLIFFAGYQTVENAIRRDGFSVIKKALAKEYGEEDARAWMEAWTRSLVYGEDNSIQDSTDVLYDWVVKLETLSAQFVQKKIEALNSREDVIRFTEIFRRYKATGIMDFDQENVSYTTEILNLDALDALMLEKLEKYDVFHFTDDPEMNGTAIRSLLIRKETSAQQPNDLFHGSEYCYLEKDGIGYLYMRWEDYEDGAVLSFTKDGFRFYEEIYDWKPWEYYPIEHYMSSAETNGGV